MLISQFPSLLLCSSSLERTVPSQFSETSLRATATPHLLIFHLLKWTKNPLHKRSRSLVNKWGSATAFQHQTTFYMLISKHVQARFWRKCFKQLHITWSRTPKYKLAYLRRKIITIRNAWWFLRLGYNLNPKMQVVA